jgi:hypothetical protein
VPLILGMTFLKEMKPVVDFGNKSVCIEGMQLKVVALGKPRVAKHVQFASVPTSNSFADLEVSDVVVVGENGVEATLGEESCVPTLGTSNLETATCGSCGKQLKGSCLATC